jgi:hypothetical protein
VEETPEEFIAKFTYQLKNLIKHAFIPDEQASFFRTTRFNLLPNDFAVQLDLLFQNEIQSAHWNRISYIKEQGQLSNEEPKSLSYVIISIQF